MFVITSYILISLVLYINYIYCCNGTKKNKKNYTMGSKLVHRINKKSEIVSASIIA